MIHFSFDDVQQRPEVCRMLLQLVIGPHFIKKVETSSLHVIEKEILRLAWRLDGRVRPKDVTDLLKIDFRTSRNWLRSLVDKGMLEPKVKGGRIRSYELLKKSEIYLAQ